MALERYKEAGGNLSLGVTSPYVEIEKAYDKRVRELASQFESPPMKAYRQAVLQVLGNTVRIPQSHTIKLFEYGAGIGRITQEVAQHPQIAQKQLEVMAVDVSAQSLLTYEKNVMKSRQDTKISSLHSDVVSALNKLSPLSKFDVAYGFGRHGNTQ